MDGEDMVINLPYAEIREGTKTWGKCLDEVREARLVVPRLGEAREDVRIERRTNDVVGLTGWGGAVWADVAFGNDESELTGKVGVRELL